MIIVNSINNKKVLGLNIGISNKGTAGTDFSERRRDPGYIYSDSGIKEFQLPEIAEVENRVIIYSKDLDFKVEPTFEGNIDITSIQRLIKFYVSLKQMDVELPIFSSNLFYSLENGDILMMPPKMIEFINNRESLAKKLSHVSIYRHPDLSGEKSLLYSIGILLFKVTTDSYPIVFTNVEDLRDKMRRKKLLEPKWKNVNITPEIDNLILNLLDIETTLDLDLTLRKLNDLVEKGIYRDDGDYSEEVQIFSQKENSLLKFEERRAFLLKHRGFIIGSAFLFIVLSIFFGTIVNNALKPPQTAGFSPSQVVETYFESFQTLDPELIDDVLAKGVRKHDSTEISTLYVTFKMRTQTDPTARMLSPAEWLLLDEENIKGSDVYGIHDLSIQLLEENVYKVIYEKWYTQAEGEDLSQDVVMGVYKLNREEIFTLEETKYSYEIVKIETLLESNERVW